MSDKLKSWAFGAFVAILFALNVIGAFGQCSAPVATQNGKIDTVLIEHRDTLVKLDTLRKTRIKYIDTSKIVVVHDMLDSLVPIDTADNDGNQMIASNQLREALRWKDSLNTCIEMRKVDSVTIDTLAKIGKEKAQSSILDQAKSFGLGTLFGITIRSLF